MQGKGWYSLLQHKVYSINRWQQYVYWVALLQYDPIGVQCRQEKCAGYWERRRAPDFRDSHLWICPTMWPYLISTRLQCNSPPGITYQWSNAMTYQAYAMPVKRNGFHVSIFMRTPSSWCGNVEELQLCRTKTSTHRSTTFQKCSSSHSTGRNGIPKFLSVSAWQWQWPYFHENFRKHVILYTKFIPTYP